MPNYRFSRIDKILYGTGSLSIDNSPRGAHRTVKTPDSEEAVLNTIEEYPNQVLVK